MTSGLRIITSNNAAGKLDWPGLVAALKEGHLNAKPQIGDLFLQAEDTTLLSRSAHVPGIGFGVKSVTITASNPSKGLPSVQGAMLLFDEQTSALKAIIENDLITAWKTAGDSVLGAKLLARPDSTSLLLVGAGKVAANLASAYSTIFPGLNSIAIWNRTPAGAEALCATLAQQGITAVPATDLADAVREADIVSCATMSQKPVIHGDWVKPGTHVDLIGAFKADMREADDALLQKAAIFVDSRETTIAHIGELMIPLAAGTITRDDIRGDLHDLARGDARRQTPEQITLFKNGGGAHLDLMTANYILSAI